MTDKLGPYRLESMIGRGGMGEVHRAFDTARNRTVALKLLLPVLASDPGYVARFRAEASIAASLTEAHIIPVHDFGEIDGRLFIDMRLVEGVDLAVLLKRDGPLRTERAVDVVTQVGSALDSAHEQGLVHRDIKPANVLLADDFAYVADFGIARPLGGGAVSLTMTGAMLGSPTYMAPERFTAGHGDHRVDVYALGCLLFELLTGRAPFPATDPLALMYAHAATPPPRPSELVAGLPSGLDEVVGRAMAKDPDHRYPSAGALAAAARLAADPADATDPGGWAAGGRDGLIGSAGWAAGGRDGLASVGPAGLAPVSRDGSGLVGLVGFAAGGHDGSTPVDPSGTVPVGRLDPARVGAPGSAAASPRIAPAAARPMWRRGRDRGRRLSIAVAVATVLFTAAGSALSLHRSEAAEVVLEARNTAGANPFMPAVGRDSDQVQPAVEVGAEVGGGAPGLYGGSRDTATCDTGTMVSFLRSHPDQASAWAGVQGIGADEVPGYVGSLTPVALRFDTLVTNHGFRGGHANPFQAVLQSGTAVLVDEFGVPRAKCFCGNPLLPPLPQPQQSSYAGPPWPEFSPQRVTAVTPAKAPVRGFRLVDMRTGLAFTRAPSSDGEDDSDAANDRDSDVQPDPSAPPDPLPMNGGDEIGPDVVGGVPTELPPSSTSGGLTPSLEPVDGTTYPPPTLPGPTDPLGDPSPPVDPGPAPEPEPEPQPGSDPEPPPQIEPEPVDPPEEEEEAEEDDEDADALGPAHPLPRPAL